MPHTGLFSIVRGELIENSNGSVGILLTHHFEMSWLKIKAAENMYPIFVTLPTSQFPMGWLNEELL